MVKFNSTTQSMKSWVLSTVGMVCLLGALTAPAVGQGGGATRSTTPNPTAATEQKTFKEVKFKIEWITTNASNQQTKSVETESIVVSSGDGQTTMTANPISGTNSYRRVTLHPEIQADGSYLVNIGISEFGKDQDRDTPRLDTTVKVRSSETKVIQARNSKGTNYNFEYLITITPGVD